MANGTIVPSEACWKGYACLGNIRAEISFEVFDSGGSWAFLFGKPSIEAFHGIHNYVKDTIEISGIGGSTTITNQAKHPHYVHVAKVTGTKLTLDIKQYDPAWFTRTQNITVKDPPNIDTYAEQVVQTAHVSDNEKTTEHDKKPKTKQRTPKSVKRARQRRRHKAEVLAKKPKAQIVGGRRWARKKPTKTRMKPTGSGELPPREVPPHKTTNEPTMETNDAAIPEAPTATPICVVSDNEETLDTDIGTDIPMEGLRNNTIYTRHNDPFKTERVQAVIDLSTDELKQAQDLI
jgi:hypothetical protein